MRRGSYPEYSAVRGQIQYCFCFKPNSRAARLKT
jgi:hypothetical protein